MSDSTAEIRMIRIAWKIADYSGAGWWRAWSPEEQASLDLWCTDGLKHYGAETHWIETTRDAAICAEAKLIKGGHDDDAN